MSEIDLGNRRDRVMVPVAPRHPIAIPVFETYGKPLTDRQRQVLELSAQGLSQANIAAELGVSFNTVVSHKRLLRAKLGAVSTVDAVAIGIGTGEIHRSSSLVEFDSARLDNLTPRQKIIFDSVVLDYGQSTYADLSSRLGVKEQSLKNAVGKIFRKLGLRNRMAAVSTTMR